MFWMHTKKKTSTKIIFWQLMWCLSKGKRWHVHRLIVVWAYFFSTDFVISVWKFQCEKLCSWTCPWTTTSVKKTATKKQLVILQSISLNYTKLIHSDNHFNSHSVRMNKTKILCSIFEIVYHIGSAVYLWRTQKCVFEWIKND